MNNVGTMKIILTGAKYKNEIRLDVSELELEEIEMLAAQIVKTMLRESDNLPKEPVA